MYKMLQGFNLDIEGFGIINEAHIEIGKINVVGGVNSSGKSTASKLLYCFLKSMSLNRKDYLLAAILPTINKFINYMAKPDKYLENDLPDKYTVDDDLLDIILDYDDAKEKYNNGLKKYINLSEITDDMVIEIEKFIPILLDVNELGVTSVDKYLIESSNIKHEDNPIGYNDSFYKKSYSTILKSLFKNESLLNFEGKSCFYNDSFKASVSYEYTESDHFGSLERYLDLATKEGLSKDDFHDFDNQFIYFTEGVFEFLTDVFYIDSISAFDVEYYLNKNKNKKIKDVFGYKEHVEYLLKQLRNDNDIKPELSEEQINKIDNINDKISKIIGGHTYRTIGDEIFFDLDYYFIPTNSEKQFNIHISSGIQQISIIQILLDNYKLYPGCFIIIDEPEVNLHPEWQFKFAEILVLLAKELDITLYLNSHSPMFIEAIEVLSQYYDLEDETNFYLTEKQNNNKYNFVKVDYDNLFAIYDNLAKPFDIIEAYRLKNEYKNGNYL